MNRQLLGFYEEQLFESILPFWFQKAIDREYGGFYTCFSNDGAKLLSKDKYVWSQGRFIWLLSKLTEIDKQRRYDYLALARSGYQFLKQHCLMAIGHCVFLLSRDGKPMEPVPGCGFDTSISVDCFVILGFSKYAAVSGDQEPLEDALRLYDSVLDRINRNEFRTEPYPIPQGYISHGIPMILLNTGQELAAALDKLGHPRCESVRESCNGFLREIIDHFFIPDNLIMEMVNPHVKQDNSMLGRYINPGHSIEDMWFIMHQALQLHNHKIVELAASVVEKVFEIGWDQECGGLFLFVDKEGGKPKGETEGFENEPMLDKLTNDWDNKLWWPHSEALYTTLLGYYLTNKESLLQLYQNVSDYTFKTFPNPDREVGEWIQIRDRQGKPIEKVVALPVKDPFHIARNFILIIDLLRKVSKTDDPQRR